MQAFPNAETRLLGVVGHPISHSLSPAFWNPALRQANENAVFLAFDVEPASFTDFINGMRTAGACGFNVTVPHKLAAFELATERTFVADQTGAVNVLVFREGGVLGSNTDVHGVKEAVGELEVEATNALVLGAGGAGRAAVHALTELGIEVTVTNRTANKARELSERTVDWDARHDATVDFDLLVNATSVGLDGRGSVLDQAAFEKAGKLQAVLDVVYRPDETPLVHAARAAGLKAADGLAMLVHQAGAAYELLLNAKPQLERLREYAWQYAGRPPEPKDYRGPKPLI